MPDGTPGPPASGPELRTVPEGTPAPPASGPEVRTVPHPAEETGSSGAAARGPRAFLGRALTALSPRRAGGATGRRRARWVVLGCAIVAVLLIAAGMSFLLRPWPWENPLTVAGAFGERPRVTFADGGQPDENLTIETVIAGTGATAARGDLAVVEFASYAWSGESHKPLDSSHEAGRLAVMRIGQLIPGLNEGLAGKKAGSRVVMSIPPKDGYGPNGSEEAGVTGSDTLVFVVDLVAVYPKTSAARGRELPVDPALPQVRAGSAGAAPTVTIPESDPPGELRAQTLIEGDGAPIRADQTLITHYQGQVWRSGKVFDSSWSRGEVAPMSSLAGAIPGISEGLAGKKVGSRVLLVIPPKDGFREDAPHTDIKKDDTVVFVVDILGAY